MKVLFNLVLLSFAYYCVAHFSILGCKQIYMKQVLLFSSIALLFLASSFKPINGLEDVISALRSGNSQQLSKYFDDNIEISMPDKSDSYSKAQAVMVLKDFFNTNGVKGFEVQFKGENAGNQYCVGKLVTNSINYRTTVFMKTKDGKQLVKEIRFQAN